MTLKRRLGLFLKTLNPDKYPDLCEQLSLPAAFGQFLFSFLLLFLLMAVLFIPGMFIQASKLQQAVGSFDELSLGGNFSASAPVTLLAKPLIVVDLRENASIGKAVVLLTKEGVSWKQWYFFGNESRPWSELTDAKAFSGGAYLLLGLFFLPALAFWAGVFLLIQYLALIVFFSLLALLIARLFRLHLAYTDSLKISLFSSIAMMFVEMTLFPFYLLFWLPFLLYLVSLVIGIALVGERDLKHEKGKGKHGKDAKGSHLEIWE